jgi:hypothetical protein
LDLRVDVVDAHDVVVSNSHPVSMMLSLPPIDESAVDGDVVHGGHTHDWKHADGPSGD